MRFAVIQFPASNCDQDALHVLRNVFGQEADYVWHKDTDLRGAEAVIVPGGFSYGDYLRCGAIARFSPIMQAVQGFAAAGGLVLGICNGFQVLVRLGLLPGPDAGPHDFAPRAALTNNDRLGYRDAWVRLGVDRKSTCAWTRGLSTLEVPARHGEGKFVAASDEALDRLEHRGQVAFRYLDAAGQPTEAWPHNPNGSARGVAGVTDATGRILGLMPHPDAFLYPWHHPDYARRRKALEAQEPGGLAIFRAGVTGF